MKDLKVKIPKKFKKSLEQRFSYEDRKLSYYKDFYEIKGSCPLCKKFFMHACIGCLFDSFEEEDGEDGHVGCVSWITKTIGEKPLFDLLGLKVSWKKEDNEKVKEQFRKIREKSEELIEWI